MTGTSLQALNHVVALTGGHVGEDYDRQGKKCRCIIGRGREILPCVGSSTITTSRLAVRSCHTTFMKRDILENYMNIQHPRSSDATQECIGQSIN